MMRVSERWKLWIEEVLLADPSEDVSWDLGLAALPDGVDQFVGFMIIEVMIPGEMTAIEGRDVPTVIDTRGLLPPWATEEQVQQTVSGLLDDLRERRAAGPLSSSPATMWTPGVPGAS